MTFAVGIFDLFTYAIPGSLHLALVAYVAARLGWLDVGKLHDIPSVLLIVGAAIASYLIGHCTYGLGTLVDRISPLWRSRSHHFRTSFVSKVPAAKDRPYVQAHPTLLLAAADLHNRDAAAAFIRLRALGLMLRNAGVAMVLALCVALIEVVIGPHRLVAAGAAVFLLLAFCGSVVQNYLLRNWANLRTLELCYWIPDIDEKIAAANERP